MSALSWDDEEYESDLAAFDYLRQDEPENPSVLLFSATNPAGTVTASATVSGRIHQIELAPDVVAMTEFELMAEVMETAKLASLKGRAAQYALIEGTLNRQGLDAQSTRDFLDHHLDLPTPAQAEHAEVQSRARYLRGER